MGLEIILRYVCSGCEATSPNIRLTPTGHPCKASIPCCCTRCGEFMAVTFSMGLDDVRRHLVRVEGARDDRIYAIRQELEKRQLEREKLGQAFKIRPGHERLRTTLVALSARIEALENDVRRHQRLPSEIIGLCKTHESRLITDGVERYDKEGLCPACKVALIPLWPLPWEQRDKIRGFPCPKCKAVVKEELMSV